MLTPDEADHLFRILRQLKDQGKTVILITHKLREIMAITDTVSVMRRGEMVATREDREDHAGGACRADGRPPRAAARREEAGHAGRAAAARSKNLAYVDAKGVRRFSDVSFEVRAGEIVGIAGVAGNGQSELLEVLAGIRQATSGEMILDGEPIVTGRASIRRCCARQGLAHVPEDRHRTGLVLAFEE